MMHACRFRLEAPIEGWRLTYVDIFFFPSLLLSRRKGGAVLLGSLQAQTVFILASVQMCFW